MIQTLSWVWLVTAKPKASPDVDSNTGLSVTSSMVYLCPWKMGKSSEDMRIKNNVHQFATFHCF